MNDNFKCGSIAESVTALADSLDGLADLGVTMWKIDNPFVVGRDDFITRQLKLIKMNAHSLCSRLDQLDLGLRIKSQLRFAILNSSDNLVRAFASISRQLGQSVQHSAREVVDNWITLRNTIHYLCTISNLDSEPWYRPIVERQASYQRMIGEVLRR